MLIKPNLWLVLALALISVPTIPVSSASERLRIASWNLNNLHYQTNKPLRSRAPARSDADYMVLRRYVSALNADIIAFQEVNGPRAAARIFPADQYDIFVSGRYASDRKLRHDSDRIYTGFAVRKARLDTYRVTNYRALSVTHADGRPTRWGIGLDVTIGEQRLRLLNVHLKSRCFTKSLRKSRNAHCATLARQVEPLEQWIDAAERSRVAFVVLGDFNRAFDVHQTKDELWRNIDDADPPGLRLFRYPFRQSAICWHGTSRYHENPIDFIVLNEQANRWSIQGSFKQWDYNATDQNPTKGLPSDHCPISLDLKLP